MFKIGKKYHGFHKIYKKYLLRFKLAYYNDFLRIM